MLAGRIYRSPYAHAEILEVDISEALKLPGVKAIVTGADCDKTFGVLPIARSEHPLARDKVRYKGEPVAAVAAIDEATAEKARRASSRCRCASCRPISPPATALAPDAVAAARQEARQPRARRAVRARQRRRTASPQADLVREATYNCAEVCQNQMEMHAAVADYDAVRDRMTVHASHPGALLRAPDAGADPRHGHVADPRGQAASSAAASAAAPRRLNVELIAALLARKAGGAVRIVLNREETFITHRGRPETDIRLKIGLRKDGRITAVECECIQRGGAHSGYGVVTILYAGSMLYAIYDLHNVKYIGKRVLTNTPPCGAFRGHGTVDVRFAFESLLDQMAGEMGLDPLAVRRANSPRRRRPSPTTT